MFYGLLAISLGEDGLVVIILAAVAGIVWLVRLEGTSKSTKESLNSTNKSVEKVKCRVDNIEESVRDIDLKCELTHKDVGFIKEGIANLDKKIEEQKEQYSKIIDLLTK